MGRYLDLASAALSHRWARRAAALLSAVEDAERRAELRDAFEERAAILEFDAGFRRDVAEHMAFQQLTAAVGTNRAG